MERGRVWSSVVEPFLDALHPARCRLCGGYAGNDLACSEHPLPPEPAPPRCGRCAAGLAPVLPDGAKCVSCRRRSPPFHRAVVLADYRDESVRAWVLALRHGGRVDLAEPLGALLGERLDLEQDGQVDELLVPVPLHRWRRIERGYDQAERLARAAARAAHRSVAPVLSRLRSTAPQGSAGTASRAANVRGAFAARRGARERVLERDVWLVDDVVTSCATVSECARVLRRLGARRVGVLAVARAGADDGRVLRSPV